jgi:hypothetical protein
MTRLTLGLFAVLLASLGASGQSKIYIERDGQCNPTSWNGNTVQCGAWAQMAGKVWTLACAQQKDNTNDCVRLLRGTYGFDVLKKDSICDPMTQAPCIQRERILMKLRSTPRAVYTAVETALNP